MNRRVWIHFATVAALSTAVIFPAAACSGGGTGGNPTSETKAAAEINQENLEFVPGLVTVRVGDVVVIRNGEAAIHNAVVNGKNVTGNMKKGDAIRWQAPAAGEYTVTCDYHPLMKATITVTP